MYLSDLAAICALFCGNGDDDDDEEKADTDAEHRYSRPFRHEIGRM